MDLWEEKAARTKEEKTMRETIPICGCFGIDSCDIRTVGENENNLYRVKRTCGVLLLRNERNQRRISSTIEPDRARGGPQNSS